MRTYLSLQLFLTTTLVLTCVSSVQGESNTTPNKVEANCVQEVSLASAKSYENPFVEIDLDAVVTRPDGKQLRVPAFWAGGNEWKFRYASEQTGIHTWRTECKDKTNTGLHGITGKTEVIPCTSDNSLYKHGAIRISADQRHFEHTDGTPFLWLGDTWWKNLCKRMTWEGFQELTADRKAKGFTAVQIVCGPYPDENMMEARWENEGGKPYEKIDFSVVNPKYFDFADRRIRHRVDAGMVPVIFGGWGRPQSGGKSTLAQVGLDGFKRHWRNLIARYGAYPTVWVVGGEATDGYGPWSELAKYLKEIDPYHHPLTYHAPAHPRQAIKDNAVFDFDMVGIGHQGYQTAAQSLELMKSCQSQQPMKPALCGEACYEGHMQTNFQDLQRHLFWSFMLNGAAGHTYGAAGIWQASVEGDPGIDPVYDWTTWKEGMNYPGSTQLGINKKLLEQYPWSRFEVHPEWAEKDCFAAGIPRKVRLIYQPRRNIYNWNGTVVKGLEPDVKYSAFYFDPATGRRFDQGIIHAPSGEYKSPRLPSPQDWIFVLENKEQPPAGASSQAAVTTDDEKHMASRIISSDTLSMAFRADGKVESFIRNGGKNLINTQTPGTGFVLTYGSGDSEKVVPLTCLEFRDGKLIASSADGSRVTFAVSAGLSHVAFRIERIENVREQDKPVLSFRADFDNISPQVVPLDYMTVSKGEWASKRCFIAVSWPYLWQRGAGDPLGGFAFFVPFNDEDHNESLLHIWVEENLPHPKVAGKWTVERARRWVKEWQATFTRCDQLTITAKKPEDLDVLVDYAKQLKLNRIYMHTDTWRGAYWVYDRDPLSINTAVFPRGEADLKAFSDRLKANGMDAMMHTICYGFGQVGSKYIGKTVDKRLAHWGKGRLEKTISVTDNTILFRPAPGLTFPNRDSYGAWWHFNDVLIGDEIVRGKFINTDQAIWTLTDCQRGPQAVKHEAGEEIMGLLKAYDQNYYPSSNSTLCEETAREYAEFFNRLGIQHHEYDGGECHNDVPWGFSKWAMYVYQNTDHPITSNSSSGLPNPWDLVYRFKSGGSTILDKRGGGMAALFLHEPRRLATSPIENHFTLAHGAAANGNAFNFLKPEPMFGITPEAIQGHGLADLIAQQFSIWREVAAKLSPKQRQLISQAYYHDSSPYPLDAGHAVSKLAFEARKTASGFEVQPFCILTRGKEDVEWKTVQEFGPVLPRQYVLPGTRLRLENPFEHQAPQFIVRVMNALVEGTTKLDSSQLEVNKDLAGYLQASGVKTSDSLNAAKSPKFTERDKTLNLLQPKAEQIQDPGRHHFVDQGTALEITFNNSQQDEYFQLHGLPSYKVKSNSHNARALALTISGDGSGAFLVVQTTKDYVIPIDFIGRKEIVIPCGEVAWATGRWGLRFSSKGAGYGPIGRVAIGFGRVPANANVKVVMENLRVLGEQPAFIKNPIIHAGAGTLAISGEIKSDQYLWYQGGNTVGVYDLNWQHVATLPAVEKDFVVDKGHSEFWIAGQNETLPPWLDVQFIAKGEVMTVPN